MWGSMHPPEGERVHVLIVDESPAERQRLRGVLAAVSPSVTVCEAGSAAGALHQIERGGCQAVLLGAGRAPGYCDVAEAWAAEGSAGVVALVVAGQGAAPASSCVSLASDAGGPEIIQALTHATELAALRRELQACRVALQVAQERAVEATSLKLEFLANLGHEVRTPLQGVFEMVELLRDTPLSERQQRYLETARVCGERLLEVVNDVLTLSKMITGRFELEESYFDVRRVVDEAVRVVTPAATAKELQLDCDIAPELPWVLCGDAGRLRQVLVKLLGNAVKFTERGCVSVKGEVVAISRSSATLRLCVQDTGVGIANDHLHRIFHSFTQGDGSSSRSYEGTGLGLAISKRFVELMGGEIGVTSEPGVGSSFWFTVRLRVDSTARELPADVGAPEPA